MLYAVVEDEPLPAIHTFADNIYEDPCNSVFVESDSCTNFLIRGSLSPETSGN